MIGAVQRATGPDAIVVCAAGGLPGELHKLWRTAQPGGYHLEYGYSCMGYEIAGGLGAKMADPSREIYVMVGDGSYLMLHTELATAVAEGIKIVVVLIQNQGFASIGHLSETVGSQRFGTRYRYRDAGRADFDHGDVLPVDLAANARSFGVDVIEVAPGPDAVARLEEAVTAAKGSDRTTVIHVDSDPLIYGPDGGGWWDVPVAQVSELESTRRARDEYVEQRKKQRPLLGATEDDGGRA